MSKKDEIDLIIDRAYEACDTSGIQTYVNSLLKRIDRLEKNGVGQESEPEESLWPSLSAHLEPEEDE